MGCFWKLLFFYFPHWFLASITAGLVPFQCNWQVYFLSFTAELWWFPLSFSFPQSLPEGWQPGCHPLPDLCQSSFTSHCVRQWFVFTVPHRFFSVSSCAIVQWWMAQAGLRNPVLTLPPKYDITFSSFLAGFYRPGLLSSNSESILSVPTTDNS